MLTLSGVIAASQRRNWWERKGGGGSGGNGSGGNGDPGNGNGNGSDPFPPPPPEWVPPDVIDILQPLEEPLEGQMFGPWAIHSLSTIGCSGAGCPDISSPVFVGPYGGIHLNKMQPPDQRNNYSVILVLRTTCIAFGNARFYGGFSGGYSSLGDGGDLGYRARVIRNNSQPYIADWAMGTETSMSEQHGPTAYYTFNVGNTLDLQLTIARERYTPGGEGVFLSCSFFGYTSILI